jgi:transposase
VLHDRRELTFIFEPHDPRWAKERKALLLCIKAGVQQAREQGRTSLSEPSQQDFERRCRELVQTRLAAHPAPPKRPAQRGAPKKSEALNLLIGLPQDPDRFGRFRQDFDVPFDNKQAPSDLRLMKLRHQIAGGFRTEAGVSIFCDLRSSLSSRHKQGVHLLTALRSAMVGSPLLPPLLAA